MIRQPKSRLFFRNVLVLLKLTIFCKNRSAEEQGDRGDEVYACPLFGSDQIKLRDSRWTESIAVGSEGFVAETKVKLGTRGDHSRVYGEGNSFQL